MALTTTEAGPGSRAVRRRIEPGTLSLCSKCEERVKFVAREQGQQVIANIYVDGRWDRVEHFHDACYTELAKPYGEPKEDLARIARGRAAPAPA